MANEMGLAYGVHGATAYFIVRNNVSQPWNTSGTPAFENYNSGHYTADYAITMSEQGSSGFYAGTFPSAIPAGIYSVEARLQSGGSPAENPATDPVIGTGIVQWSGSVLEPLTGIPALLLSTAISSSPTQGTVEDALLAAEAQGFGKWTIVGTTLTIYRHDGVTVARTFTLNSATAPTARA